MLEYLISVGGFAVLALLAIGWLVARPRAAAPRRVLAAIVILYTAASIRVVPWILSSGGAAQGLQTETSAATMRAALVELGVPRNRVILEQDSRTTHDEAV